MCANYVPVTSGDELLAFFGVHRDFSRELPPELYPTDLAPFIRLVNGTRAAGSGSDGVRARQTYGKLPCSGRTLYVTTRANLFRIKVLKEPFHFFDK